MRRQVHISSIIFVLAALFLKTNIAEAQTTWCLTNRSPGSVTGNVSYGSSINWSQPNRSIGSDNLYSKVSLKSGEITKYLEDKTFSFSVPNDAVITGVVVFIERYADASSNIRDYSIRLEINGSVVGTDHGTGNAVWSSTESTIQYGSNTDSWGLTLTPNDVNSSTFGVLTSVYIPSGGPATVYDAYADNVEVLIYFQTPGTNCGIYMLPVTMGDFEAKVIEDSKVKLNWFTYSEINNDHFTIQRSSDGLNFQPIASVKGVGNSTEINYYEAIDNSPPPGTSYYRLKQTDFDGKETIEDKILTVTRIKGRDSPFSIYPNPSDGKSFQYYFSNPASEECRIIVQDFSGKEVYFALMKPDKNGTETLQFAEQLRPGVYTVFGIGPSQTFRERLLVKN
jgi:hypothetical protein